MGMGWRVREGNWKGNWEGNKKAGTVARWRVGWNFIGRVSGINYKALLHFGIVSQ